MNRASLIYGGLPQRDIMGGMGSEGATVANSGVTRDTTESAAMSGASIANPAMGDTAPTKGSPVGAFLAILVLIVGMRFFANKAGEENEYSALMPTVYNVMLITFSSILGIIFMKWLTGSYLSENNAFRRLVFTV